MNTYGYIRVSTRGQNEARQVIALEQFGIKRRNIYLDKQSGKDFERPEYQKLLQRINDGDTIVIKSIDRLGRNYNEVLEQWRFITKAKKAAIILGIVSMSIINAVMPMHLEASADNKPKSIHPKYTAKYTAKIMEISYIKKCISN